MRPVLSTPLHPRSLQAKPVPAVVSVMQCALILLAPIEPLFTHAGHVYADPALAAGAKAKAALATMHIDSDSESSEGDTVRTLCVCSGRDVAVSVWLLLGLYVWSCRGRDVDVCVWLLYVWSCRVCVWSCRWQHSRPCHTRTMLLPTWRCASSVGADH
jgi:hypothetical protein